MIAVWPQTHRKSIPVVSSPHWDCSQIHSIDRNCLKIIWISFPPKIWRNNLRLRYHDLLVNCGAKIHRISHIKNASVTVFDWHKIHNKYCVSAPQRLSRFRFLSLNNSANFHNNVKRMLARDRFLWLLLLFSFSVARHLLTWIATRKWGRPYSLHVRDDDVRTLLAAVHMRANDGFACGELHSKSSQSKTQSRHMLRA